MNTPHGKRGRTSTTAQRERAPIRQPVENNLLDPRLFKLAQHLRTGGSMPPFSQKMPWLPTRIHDGLIPWLTTGDIEQLAHLLQSLPSAIGHPAVLWELAYLRRLEGLLEEEEREGHVWIQHGADSAEGQLLPTGTCKAAQTSLRRLTAAWVHGLLGGGWTLVAPPKRRGRPRKYAEEDILFLFREYEKVLQYLKEAAGSYKRGTREKNTWLARLEPRLRTVGA